MKQLFFIICFYWYMRMTPYHFLVLFSRLADLDYENFTKVSNDLLIKAFGTNVIIRSISEDLEVAINQTIKGVSVQVRYVDEKLQYQEWREVYRSESRVFVPGPWCRAVRSVSKLSLYPVRNNVIQYRQ